MRPAKDVTPAVCFQADGVALAFRTCGYRPFNNVAGNFHDSVKLRKFPNAFKLSTVKLTHRDGCALLFFGYNKDDTGDGAFLTQPPDGDVECRRRGDPFR